MQSAAAQYSPDSTLTPTQHHVLSLLAHGTSIAAAANAAGIHRNTVANWRRTVPAFARELEFACRERSLFWHDHAAGLAEKAIEVISTILHNESVSPSIRLRAALKIVAIAADPQPAPMKPFPTSAAEAEAVTGRAMLLQALANENLANDNDVEVEIVRNPPQPAQSCTNQPVRRAPEPGRNTPCPCKSGLKYKRCCGSGRGSGGGNGSGSFNRSAAASPESHNVDSI